RGGQDFGSEDLVRIRAGRKRKGRLRGVLRNRLPSAGSDSCPGRVLLAAASEWEAFSSGQVQRRNRQSADDRAWKLPARFPGFQAGIRGPGEPFPEIAEA